MNAETNEINVEANERALWRKGLIDFPFQKAQDGAVLISYQSKHSPELIHISEQFHVASHYKGDTDFQKTLSLMNYVHGIARKSGNNTSPAIKNTDEIMKAAKLGTLWCSDYATVLSEMLLSMGVKAVTVSCLPRTFDYDRHVGVMAYLNDVGKWGFFDPTFNTYFYGEAPLDIFEIRSAYARGDAPAFRHISIKKEWKLVLHGVEYEDYDSWYSDYMLKNTFRFAFPTNSAYGCRSSNVKSVFVLPKGYDAKNEYDIPDSVYTFDSGCVLLS